MSGYLSALANRGVAASTQNQALGALFFLYTKVLNRPLPELNDVVRAAKPQRLPVVLSRGEVAALPGHLQGVAWLMASLLYGGGLRLMECVELRVKDVHFDRGELMVREGKGGRDRVTMLPTSLRRPLMAHLQARQQLHAHDLAAGQARCGCPTG